MRTRVELLGVERLGDGLVQLQHVDLGAALAQRVGQHVARVARARDQRALHRHVAERLDERLGDGALGHARRRRIAVRAQRARGARADRGDARAGERARVAPGAASRSNSSRTPFGLVRQTRSYRAGSGARPVERRDPDRRRLDDLGAERRAAAPPARSPARARG